MLTTLFLCWPEKETKERPTGRKQVVNFSNRFSFISSSPQPLNKRNERLRMKKERDFSASAKIITAGNKNCFSWPSFSSSYLGGN